MDYESHEFLVDGSVARTYDELNYHDKIKVRALQGLDKLAASLNSIANVKAIEFQISHLNTMSEGFSEEMAAKDAQIADLTTQLNTLKDNFDKFKSVLTSIDHLTDEVID